MRRTILATIFGGFEVDHVPRSERLWCAVATRFQMRRTVEISQSAFGFGMTTTLVTSSALIFYFYYILTYESNRITTHGEEGLFFDATCIPFLLMHRMRYARHCFSTH